MMPEWARAVAGELWRNACRVSEREIAMAKLSVQLPADPGWYLCYIDDPERPATKGGRVMAFSQRYDSEEAASKAALRMGIANFVSPVQVP